MSGHVVIAIQYVLDVDSEKRMGDGTEMLEMWLRHLRGPGCFQGDVILLTNDPSIHVEGILPKLIPSTCKTISDIHCLRAELLLDSFVDDYDNVLCLDIDILAQRDIAPLFATGDRIRTARSSIPMFDKKHAGFFLGPVKRFFNKVIHSRNSLTANLSTMSFQTCYRDGLIRPYVDLIRTLRGNHERFPLGDQTVFNYGVHKNLIRWEPYPESYVVHSNWRDVPDAILYHFPVAGRLDCMKQFCVV